MRRNKIDSGWNAIPQEKKKNKKKTLSWISQYESHPSIDENIFEKIVKFLISLSLFLVISRSNYLNKRKKNEIVNSTYDSLSSNKFAFVPAGVGLYFFFSLIPIVIITISVIKLFPPLYNILINDVLSYVIPGINEMFQLIDLNNALINFVFVFFIISIIWFSSKGITKFNDSIISIYEYEYNPNWILKRLKGILTVMLISGYFVLWSLSYLPLLNLFKIYIFPINGLLYELLFFVSLIVYIAVFGYIGIGFLFIYIPPFKLKWQQIQPGIITSLVPIILFVVIFGTITKYLNYEKFGAIGTFIYALMFVLYISYFLHAGIIVNASYYKTYFLSHMVKKKVILSKRIALFIQNTINYFKRN